MKHAPPHDPSLTFVCIVRFFELWLNSRLAMVSARVRIFAQIHTRFTHTRVRTGAVEEVGVLEKPNEVYDDFKTRTPPPNTPMNGPG